VMAPMQVSPRIIMVHEESGIKTLGDLNNITLAMSPTDAFATFIAKNYPLKNVKIVPYPGSPQVFLNDKNFAQQAYNISEPFTARKLGANPRNLSLAEAGYTPYTSCIVTDRKTLETKREMVRKFVQASVRGWDHYMRDPATANAAINKANPEMGLDILQFGVDTMQPMVYTEDAKKLGTGAMTAERWKALVDTMTKLELTKPGQVMPQDCFTTEFLSVQAAKPAETVKPK
jgi:NitT/TauT family transport system substrate-binding protein